MKAWTVPELDNVISTLKPLIGGRLQEIQTSDSDLVLGFYTPKGVLWLWVDLNATRPNLLPWAQLPLVLKNHKSPLNLFLRAHFRDRVLRSIERRAQEGRVVLLTFGKEEDQLELELRLFPHGRNVLARAGEKKIAWQKPKELPESMNENSSATRRTLEELREEWLKLRGGKAGGPAKSTKDVKARLEAELEKKRKAEQKVIEELGRKRDTPWKKAGDWLKTHQNLDVPKEFEPFVDKRRKLSWNIEQCFTKARENEGKLFGTEKRLEILRKEIATLQEKLNAPIVSAEPERLQAPKPTLDGVAHARTLKLSDELTVIAGKSASDNMQLLRKARAWDLWFHLRDLPSSHAILFRNKNATVSDQNVQQILDWYVRQVLGAKFRQHAGEKFEILVAECRHVKPIKGDKLGRVTYHFERVVTYRVPKP
jgi:predicted ribosome quality control (RQC) complex YloA/Tae2 family protein